MKKINVILLIFLIILIFIYFPVRRKENMGSLMQVQSKEGAYLDIPSRCIDRSFNYCKMGEGCEWIPTNDGSLGHEKCKLKKGWVGGALGSMPIYTKRRCKDRDSMTCESTPGCKKIIYQDGNYECAQIERYKETKDNNNEIIYIPKLCTERTIDNCAAGKECLWYQGHCRNREEGQKFKNIFDKQKTCNIDSTNVSYGENTYICSDKPMPIEIVKKARKNIIKRNNIPIIDQSKRCLPRKKHCKNKTPPSSLLFGQLTNEEFEQQNAHNYIRQLEDSVKKIKRGFKMCAVECGKKPAKCVKKEMGRFNGRNLENHERYNCDVSIQRSKQECENAFGGDICKWVDDEWKKCTPNCKKWNCENCEKDLERQIKKRKQKTCMRHGRMRPVPFERLKQLSREKVDPVQAHSYTTATPRISEMNISMNLNSNLVPFNQKNYALSDKINTFPGRYFNNCQFKLPTTSFFNQNFHGATKCGLLGNNQEECHNLKNCKWFDNENSFRSSRLGKRWKEEIDVFEVSKNKEKNINEAIKYLYQKDPIVAKAFVKQMKLPNGVERDTFKMIDFLQTYKGKQWAAQRMSLSFDMWVLDYMINHSR